MISNAGSLDGIYSPVFVFSAGLGSLSLAGAAILGLIEVVTPPDYSTAAADQLRAFDTTAEILAVEISALQVAQIAALTKAAHSNAVALDGTQKRLARAYSTFAIGLGFAVLSLLALLTTGL